MTDYTDYPSDDTIPTEVQMVYALTLRGGSTWGLYSTYELAEQALYRELPLHLWTGSWVQVLPIHTE